MSPSQPQAPVTEQDLPGIGRRFDVRVGADRLAIVLHHTGRRDVYVHERGADDPAVVVELTDAEARTVGAVLAGAYFRPSAVEDVDAAIGSLLIDWVTLEAGSPGDGHSIAELEIRRATRMTVAAIVREGDAVVAPEPDYVMQAGDRLVVVGRHQDLAGFKTHVVDRAG